MTELPGLVSSSPICAMASLGLMRVLTQDLGVEACLGWRQGKAYLEGLSEEEAVQSLMTHMTQRSEALEWNWSDSTRRLSPDRYRAICQQAKEAGDRRAMDFMAGWATDAVLKDDGTITPTSFDMTSGQQGLIKELRNLAKKLAKTDIAQTAFVSALLGGAYDEQTSYGWDPIGARSHAHERQAPGKSTPPGKPGLVWLAAESLPLHPIIPVSATRARTTGWYHSDSTWHFYWFTWSELLTFDEIRLLRSTPIEAIDPRRGVTEIWRSEKKMFGKYGGFLPGRRER